MTTKHIGRFIIYTAVTTFVLLLAIPAYADGTYTPITNVSVVVSDSTSSTHNPTGTITVTAKGSDGLWGWGASSKTAKIKITNNGTSKATISCTVTKTSVYSLTTDKGTLTDTSFSVDLDPSGTATLELTTAKNSTENKVVLSGFDYQEAQATSKVTIVFDGNLGSVTAGRSAITSGYVADAVSQTDGIALAATPNNGVTFLGWINDTSKTMTMQANGTYTPTQDITLRAVFASASSDAWFLASGMYYYNDLNDAATKAATESNKTVVLLADGTLPAADGTLPAADGTLPADDYTIPSGVTLLIPFDSANTVVTNTAGNNLLHAYDTTVTARSQYRKLTMGADTKITVASGGAISIGSKLANQFIGQVGPYGAIYMEEGSNITVQSGGYLYAWGYIFHGEEGSGTVTVESGGTVYEPLSTMDYPGSASLVSDLRTGNVFPMRSYSIRNVEVTMTLNSGAKEYGFACLYGSNFFVGTNPLYVLLIANGSVNDETPVFQNSGTITKSYEDSRMHMVIDGNLTLNSLIVEVAKSTGPVSISSSSTSGFYIPSCWDVEAKSGTTTLNDNVIMCEGSTFTISNGAVVDTSGNNVYVLDADNDPGAVVSTNGCSIDVQDVHGKYYTNVPNDAVLDINGTLITSGGFYTSAAGACITSSEGGGVIQVSGTSTSGTVKVKNTNAYTEVAINAAWLKNEDGTYVLTGEEGTGSYYYAHGLWHTEEPKWANGTCTVCGAEFNIYGANIKVTDGLDMFFYVKNSDVASGEYYALVTKYFADNSTVTATIELEDWDEYSSALMRFGFDDISAKEMTDKISVVIYNSDGTSASNTWDDSVEAYALRALEKYPDDSKLVTALVDMLNYGKAAQEYFGYNGDDLADPGDYSEKATKTVEFTDSREKGTNYVGSTVSAKNNLLLTFYFQNITEDMTATISYTDRNGEAVSYTVDGENFVPLGSYLGVDVTGLAIAEGQILVTCEVKNEETVVASAKDSVESYVARSTTQGSGDVYEMLMKFVQSAYTYFEKTKGAAS